MFGEIALPAWVFQGLPWFLGGLAFAAAIIVWRAFSAKAAAIRIGLAAIMALAGGAISAGSSAASMWEVTHTAGPAIQGVMTAAFGLLPAFALVAKLNRQFVLMVLLAGLSIGSSYASFYAMLETAATASKARVTDNHSTEQERKAAQAELEAALAAQGQFTEAVGASRAAYTEAVSAHEALRLRQESDRESAQISARLSTLDTQIAEMRREASEQRAAADCEVQGPRGCTGFGGRTVQDIGNGPGYKAAKNRYEVLMAQIGPMEAERASLRLSLGATARRLAEQVSEAAEARENVRAAMERHTTALAAAQERTSTAREAVKAARVDATPGQAEKVWSAIGAAITFGGRTDDLNGFVFIGSLILALTFDLINLSFARAERAGEGSRWLGVWGERDVLLKRLGSGSRAADLLRTKIEREQELHLRPRPVQAPAAHASLSTSAQALAVASFTEKPKAEPVFASEAEEPDAGKKDPVKAAAGRAGGKVSGKVRALKAQLKAAEARNAELEEKRRLTALRENGRVALIDDRRRASS